MKKTKTNEFESIVSDIWNHPKFIELKKEFHHGISRYDHSVRVAKMTYYVTKKLNLDYEKATRAALLHDFFLNEDTINYNKPKTLQIHPEIALFNAKKYFDIDTKQSNIIASHMYPIFLERPKYAESWVVTCSDKAVAVHEMARFKLSATMGIWLIFLFNMITIQK